MIIGDLSFGDILFEKLRGNLPRTASSVTYSQKIIRGKDAARFI